jgi:hypothetical protein
MQAHSRALLEQMLPQAESFVARGAERIRAQQVRVTALRQKEPLAEVSKKLLALMQQTQELQILHVRLLRRELANFD